MGPLVSVVIPIYNAEAFLAECVDSVIRSDYDNIEIILVDDGSTDGSAAICDRYAREYGFVKVIHQKNSGVSAARNVGLRTFAGDYIMFVDADDTVFSYAVRVLVASAMATDAEMTVGKISADEPLPIGVHTGESLLKMALEDRSIAFYSVRILYKRAFVRSMRFVEGRTRSEDAYFIFLCAIRFPCVSVIEDVVYTYNHNSGSATRSSFSKKHYDDIRYLLAERGEFLKERFPRLLPLYYNLVVRVNMQLLSNMVHTKGKMFHLQEQESLREFRMYKKYFLSTVPYNTRMYSVLRNRMYYLYKRMLACKKRWNRCLRRKK